MSTSTYTVTTPVHYGTTAKDVRRYEPDEPIELDDETAGPLLAAGAIRGPIEKKTAAGK